MQMQQPFQVPFGNLVGDTSIPESVTMWQFPNTPGFEPWIPQITPNYSFRTDLLIKLRNYLLLPNGDGFYLTGPTGSGKTSLVNELAGRCRWPVQSQTCNARFEYQSLVGQFVFQSEKPGSEPVMKFRYGPLAVAMKLGHILLLNEIDLADPGELTGLNDVLEGRPLVIAENASEVIRPHPFFRVIVTANSAGYGDYSGGYKGVNEMNAAFMDRFRIAKVPYMDAEQEIDLMVKSVSVDNQLAQNMVAFANEIRNSHLQGKGTPMSTRVLLRWAHLCTTYRGHETALQSALDEAFLQRLTPSELLAVHQSAIARFGDLYQPAKAA